MHLGSACCFPRHNERSFASWESLSTDAGTISTAVAPPTQQRRARLSTPSASTPVAHTMRAEMRSLPTRCLSTVAELIPWEGGNGVGGVCAARRGKNGEEDTTAALAARSSSRMGAGLAACRRPHATRSPAPRHLLCDSRLQLEPRRATCSVNAVRAPPPVPLSGRRGCLPPRFATKSA